MLRSVSCSGLGSGWGSSCDTPPLKGSQTCGEAGLGWMPSPMLQCSINRRPEVYMLNMHLMPQDRL